MEPTIGPSGTDPASLRSRRTLPATHDRNTSLIVTPKAADISLSSGSEEVSHANRHGRGPAAEGSIDEGGSPGRARPISLSIRTLSRSAGAVIGTWRNRAG